MSPGYFTLMMQPLMSFYFYIEYCGNQQHESQKLLLLELLVGVWLLGEMAGTICKRAFIVLFDKFTFTFACRNWAVDIEFRILITQIE